MIKYVDTKVVMSEVPDEITLAINLSNCPCHCKGCHSSYLAEDIGKELTLERLHFLAIDNDGITTIAFMGGDNDPKRINRLAKYIKERLDLKVAWYSGRQELSKDIDLENFDYIKLGPYIEELGGLNNPNTNQRMYKYSELYSDITIGKGWRDITNRFWKHEN